MYNLVSNTFNVFLKLKRWNSRRNTRLFYSLQFMSARVQITLVPDMKFTLSSVSSISRANFPIILLEDPVARNRDSVALSFARASVLGNPSLSGTSPWKNFFSFSLTVSYISPRDRRMPIRDFHANEMTVVAGARIRA